MYARNSAAMWESRAPWSRTVPGMPPGLSVVEVPAQSATRVILRRPFAADPAQVAALMARAGAHGRVVVEDSFGELTLPAADGVTVDRMPVMARASVSCWPPIPARWLGPSG